MAGFEEASSAILQGAIVLAWNLLCTIVALWLVDRTGRRPLLLVGTLGMAFGLLVLGLLFQLKAAGSTFLLAMFPCIGFHAISLAPLGWLIMAVVLLSCVLVTIITFSHHECHGLHVIFPW